MIKTIILIAVLTLLSQWEVKLRMKREGASKEYTVLQHVVDFTVMMQWGAILSAFNLDYQGVAKQVPEKVPKKYFFGFLFTLFLTSTTTLQRQKQ